MTVMKYTASESWVAFGAGPTRALEQAAIRGAARRKHFNWNMALGMGTVLLVSAAGWAGVLFLVSSLVSR